MKHVRLLKQDQDRPENSPVSLASYLNLSFSTCRMGKTGDLPQRDTGEKNKEALTSIKSLKQSEM